MLRLHHLWRLVTHIQEDRKKLEQKFKDEMKQRLDDSEVEREAALKRLRESLALESG